MIDGEDSVSFKQAIFELSKRFIPWTLSFFVEYGVLFTNILFISMLNDPTLISGCGLGFTTVNVVVFSLDVGIWGGIDTLVSQAYGRRDYHLWGVYLNTARIFLTILFFVQFAILINWNAIFVSLGLPPESSEVAHNYILSVLPGVYMAVQLEWLRRFLTVQGVYNPILYILSGCLVVHIISLYLYILVLDLKIVGIAIATATTYSINWIGLTLYIHFKKDLINRESWILPNIFWITKIPEFLKYGVPSCLMLLFQWWAFEIIYLYCGWLGIKQLAASVIMINISVMMFLIPLGIAVWATNLVGNYLGANKPNKARIFSYASITFGIWTESVLLILFLVFKDWIISIYSVDEDVVYYINEAYFLWFIFSISDLFQGIWAGTIRAIGFQNKATIVAILYSTFSFSLNDRHFVKLLRD